MPSSSAWTARTSGTATTGCWRRCCGPSCAAASRELEAELHRRASRWHAEHDDVDAAIRHAAARRATSRLAGDLLWANAFRYIPQGHNATVRRWLGHFTDDRCPHHAPLALVAANAHLADGDRDHAEHWTAAAARALDRGRRAPAPELDAGVAALRAAIARDGVQRMRDGRRARLRARRRRQPLARAWIGSSRDGVTCWAMRERASALLEEGRGGAWSPRRASTLCASPSSRCCGSTATTGAAPPSSPTARALPARPLLGWPDTRR